LPISDWGLLLRANRHSAIANRKSEDPPATAGGTDFMTLMSQVYD
jgi:hypothetical protein